jgi:hypothetical protein
VIEDEGFWVFGLRTTEEHPKIKGSEWAVANILITRYDNPKIINLNLTL